MPKSSSEELLELLSAYGRAIKRLSHAASPDAFGRVGSVFSLAEQDSRAVAELAPIEVSDIVAESMDHLDVPLSGTRLYDVRTPRQAVQGLSMAARLCARLGDKACDEVLEAMNNEIEDGLVKPEELDMIARVLEDASTGQLRGAPAAVVGPTAGHVRTRPLHDLAKDLIDRRDSRHEIEKSNN